MKNKAVIFPALILLLSPFVWYSNQLGIDEKKGIDFLMSPVCLTCLLIVIVGCIALCNAWVFLIGNLLFVVSLFLYVYNQGKMFEGNSYSLMEIVFGLQPGGIVVICVAMVGCLFSIMQMMKKHSRGCA